ncbi:MAG: PaaI family thioesterase, partial [Actinobacteria bacterium]|nr:PaaI family thioesterase [Actinomycetota bacterium]
LGLEVVHFTEGTSEVRLRWQEALGNLSGSVHGGALMALGDVGTAFAIFSLLPARTTLVTVNLTMSFLAASRGTDLICRGRAVRVGRRIATGEARIEDGGGTLVATCLGTFLVRDGERPGRIQD